MEIDQILRELDAVSDTQGTLASLIVRKKGLQRGTGTSRQVYDNDLVHVLLWTGFDYGALVERSQKQLLHLEEQGHLIKSLQKATAEETHREAPLEDVCAAIQELKTSFRRPAKSESAGNGLPPLKAEVWKPLKVGDHFVKRAKVYQGDPSTAGTIYLDGVKLGEKVIEPAEHWKTGSNTKTTAKNVLRSWLPIGLYASYCLEPSRVVMLWVDREAVRSIRESNLTIDPEAVRLLFKVG